VVNKTCCKVSMLVKDSRGVVAVVGCRWE
jgi:hypothetical protein